MRLVLPALVCRWAGVVAMDANPFGSRCSFMALSSHHRATLSRWWLLFIPCMMTQGTGDTAPLHALALRVVHGMNGRGIGAGALPSGNVPLVV